ncbi:MAG: hypothetical protein J5856_04465 [Lachnospiraceae bacterium]|nr:hypothetical protein [Lachnospiraceae bacterium]
MNSGNNSEWIQAKNELMKAMASLNFPERLGEEVCKNLKYPAAIRRMTAYLYNVRPKTAELVVDEMLSICSEIEAWKDKKASEHAWASYNDWLNNKPF